MTRTRYARSSTLWDHTAEEAGPMFPGSDPGVTGKQLTRKWRSTEDGGPDTIPTPICQPTTRNHPSRTGSTSLYCVCKASDYKACIKKKKGIISHYLAIFIHQNHSAGGGAITPATGPWTSCPNHPSLWSWLPVIVRVDLHVSRTGLELASVILSFIRGGCGSCHCDLSNRSGRSGSRSRSSSHCGTGA